MVRARPDRRQGDRQQHGRERYIEARRAAIPASIRYPDELPVSAARDGIAEAITENQVVVIAGETGSGKTTQIPKIALELGRGVQGMIGHTQPRRLAARTVAERIAEELGTPLGGLVGYRVRFNDRISESTAIKLMTDGILLTELQRDRDLRRYDTLIIDEAHERSLNIDFILGCLRRLLPRRSDLKLIITSATIDPQRFADHFTVPGGKPVPVLEVSGRTYPVEMRYRPLDELAQASGQGKDEPADQIDGICAAVGELSREGNGDVLVFLSGEREIRDTADALRGVLPAHTEVVPLFARLSIAEQHRVFAARPAGIRRRVVLATNVAETSLTVPGIHYVVDPGTARISRYSHRTKVQRLPIEAISQASANQRAGRCGRVAEGVCIRLYSEQDYASRPEFTDPEILRTNLASVILQMSAIGLGDIASFPFIDPPDRRAITDGLALLTELNAIETGAGTSRGRGRNQHREPRDDRNRLTPLGSRLAQLPVDPRMGRMILEAEKNGCLSEVIVIAAALSIQDVRERPQEKQQAADESHRRFVDETSDFLAYLNLWNYLRDQQHALSSGQFRRMCGREFLNYLRIREWQDLVSQLRQIARQVGMDVPRTPARDRQPEDGDEPEPVDPQRVHLSLLAGLLSHIGVRAGEGKEFTGARNTKYLLWPGSALFAKPPRWTMAAELVETSRLWARDVARIEPEWVEPLAAHLVKSHYSEPHWSSKRASAMAYERVTLYGVPIVTQRLVGYGRIDPELSRELFIRNALVEGDWRTQHRFFHANREMLENAEELENRLRRRDVVLDDDTLFDFYDARIPQNIVSGRHFDSWWKQERRREPELLTLTEEILLAGEPGLDERAYPLTWPVDGGELRLSYQFEPGTADDGVSAHVPVSLLAGLDPAPFTWQIPGLREELTTALIRSLPKAIRTSFVPAPDNARLALHDIEASIDAAGAADVETSGTRSGPAGSAYSSSFHAALAEELTTRLRHRSGSGDVPAEAFDLTKVPDHLRMTFLIEDEKGKVLARGKDLTALQHQLRERTRAAVARIAGAGVERSTVTSWDVGTLPRTVERESPAGATVSAFPALVAEGDQVAVRVLPTAADQAVAMRTGTRALIMRQLTDPVTRATGQVEHALTNAERLGLSVSPYRSVRDLITDVVDTAIDDLVAHHGGPVFEGEAFATLLAAVRAELDPTVLEIARTTSRVLTRWREVDRALSGTRSLPMLPALTDMREQVDALIHDGFVGRTGRARLPDLIRYLRGVARRLEKAPENVSADRGRMDQVHQLTDEYRALCERLPAGREDSIDPVRWMLEEFRLSLFAQGIGTAYPVSAQRIRRAIDAAG